MCRCSPPSRLWKNGRYVLHTPAGALLGLALSKTHVLFHKTSCRVRWLRRPRRRGLRPLCPSVLQAFSETRVPEASLGHTRRQRCIQSAAAALLSQQWVSLSVPSAGRGQAGRPKRSGSIEVRQRAQLARASCLVSLREGAS